MKRQSVTGWVGAMLLLFAVAGCELSGSSPDGSAGEVRLLSITITPAEPTIAAGTTRQFTAIGTFSNRFTQNLTTEVLWNSSNPGVATISNAMDSEGLAASVAVGVTSITATIDRVSGTSELIVAPKT